jgi:hypothetical protein
MNYESLREAYLSIYEEEEEKKKRKPKTEEGSGADEALYLDLMSQYNKIKEKKGDLIAAGKIKTRADKLRFKNVTSDAVKAGRDA